MKILVDENIPLMTVQALRDNGHDVLDIRGTDIEGTTDESLMDIVQKDGRLLITTDKGFTQFRNEHHFGLLIIRIRRPNRQKIHKRILQAMSNFSTEEWHGLLVVMRDTAQSVWREHQ